MLYDVGITHVFYVYKHDLCQGFSFLSCFIVIWPEQLFDSILIRVKDSCCLNQQIMLIVFVDVSY